MEWTFGLAVFCLLALVMLYGSIKLKKSLLEENNSTNKKAP